MDNEKYRKYIEIMKERRPPRLKSIDRSISMAIDNYNPQTPKQQLDIPYREPMNHLVLPDVEIISPDEAEEPNPKYSPNVHMKITSSPKPEIRASTSGHVRTPLRRSDTINIAYRQHLQQQPTVSSIDTIKIDDRYHSRRGSSIRVGASLCPPERISLSRSPSPNRRRYRNHRSFNEQTKHHHTTKPTFSLEDTKHHSLNDDLYQASNLKYQNQPYVSTERFHQKESSPIPLDKSKMHLKLQDSVPLTVTEGIVRWKNLKRQNAYLRSREDISNNHQLQHQHQSHQHQHQQQQQDIFLSPNSLKDMQIHGGSVSLRSPRHSSSMKLKSYRENLIATKKSKSFIIDPTLDYEIPIVHQQRNDHSNLHRNPQHIFVNDEITKSPRPSYGHVHDDSISSYKSQTSPYNSGEIDFAAIALKPFQHARRKSSVALAKGLKSDTLSRENSAENQNGDRKRKKITCIVMTIFLCLACASIFVVLITLTHSSSSSSSSQSQTKKIYTYSREMPIHYTGI